MLARRVTAELDRWGLIPDDSAGRPLALTLPGVLLRRLAAALGERLTPEALLILLKHPLVNSPGARAHLELTGRLETRILRGGAPHIDWDALAAWAARPAPRPDRLAPPLPGTARRHRRRPLATLVEGQGGGRGAGGEPRGGGGHRLWDRQAGQQALWLVQALAEASDAYGTMRAADYRALSPR